MNKRREHLIFFTLAFGLFAYFGLVEYLEYGPFGMHQGAQADRASIAFNYARESMNFLEPRVMENRSMHGITGMEFPIVAYATALLYKIFDYNPFFYRLIEALLFLAFGKVDEQLPCASPRPRWRPRSRARGWTGRRRW